MLGPCVWDSQYLEAHTYPWVNSQPNVLRSHMRQHRRSAYRTWESRQRLVTNSGSHRPARLEEQWGSHMIHSRALPRRQRAALLHHRKRCWRTSGQSGTSTTGPVSPSWRVCELVWGAPFLRHVFLLTFTALSKTIPQVLTHRLIDEQPVWG